MAQKDLPLFTDPNWTVRVGQVIILVCRTTYTTVAETLTMGIAIAYPWEQSTAADFTKNCLYVNKLYGDTAGSETWQGWYEYSSLYYDGSALWIWGQSTNT